MPSHVAEQAGVEDALGESPRVVDAFESVVVLAGQDRVQALPGDLEHRKVTAARRVGTVDPNAHIRDLVQGLRGPVVEDVDVVIEGAGSPPRPAGAGRGG